MLTVIISTCLMVLLFIMILSNNRKFHKKHKIGGAIRALIFSGLSIMIVLSGVIFGIITAYILGSFADGEYVKMTSNKIVPLNIDNEEIYYLKKMNNKSKHNIISLKFCYVDTDGDMNFYEHFPNNKNEIDACDNDSCNYSINYYRLNKIHGIMKYFAFSPLVYKVKIFIPLDAKFKKVYL